MLLKFSDSSYKSGKTNQENPIEIGKLHTLLAGALSRGFTVREKSHTKSEKGDFAMKSCRKCISAIRSTTGDDSQ